MSLDFECNEWAGVSYVRLRGVVSDDFEPEALLSSIHEPRVILDLAALERIADGGRRAWRRTLERLSDASKELLLWDCSSTLADQFCETPALLALSRVATYQVPYRCTSCKKSLTVRLDAATLSPDDVTNALCRGCDGKLRIQRNPEALVDLRKHSALDHPMKELKTLLARLHKRASRQLFEVHTASDLPDAFESTTSVIPTGSGETNIEELAPLLEERTHGDVDSNSGLADATRPLPSESKRRAPVRRRNPALPKTVERRPTLDATPPAGIVRAPEKPRRASRSSRSALAANFGNPLPLIAAGTGGVALGLMLGLLIAPTGLPADAIVRYAVSLNEGDFDRAQEVLESNADELPAILVDIYRLELERSQGEAADVYRQQATRAFQDERYDEAASYAVEALAISDPEGRMLYLLADALRLAGRERESAPHYRSFIESFPNDELVDDAMFWRATALVDMGRPEEAKSLLESILGMSRSNFKRSAGRLLLELH
ncbi:MAG: tetratricopeptide repeat protein [Myxococcota bacterium]